MNEESISNDDLANLRSSQIKMILTKEAAEKAILQSNIAALEHKNFELNLCLKYNLGTNKFAIDEKTGKIIKMESEKTQ